MGASLNREHEPNEYETLLWAASGICPLAAVRHEALITVRVRDPPLVVAATGRS